MSAYSQSHPRDRTERVLAADASLQTLEGHNLDAYRI